MEYAAIHIPEFPVVSWLRSDAATRCRGKVECPDFGKVEALEGKPPFPLCPLSRTVLAVKGSHSPRNRRAPLTAPRRSELHS